MSPQNYVLRSVEVLASPTAADADCIALNLQSTGGWARLTEDIACYGADGASSVGIYAGTRALLIGVHCEHFPTGMTVNQCASPSSVPMAPPV